MSTLLEAAVTPEELLTMPDGDHCELVNGELKEKDMGAALSAWVGMRVARKLDEYAELHGGCAFGDAASYRCYEDDPSRVRIPDASYIRSGRLERDEIPMGYITIPPDLAVEVVSPTDTVFDVEEKVEEYLAAGVRMVWVASPLSRSVRVFQQNIEPIQLGPTQQLSGGDVLPGFTCRVADLFPMSHQSSVQKK